MHANPELYLARSKHKQTKSKPCSHAFRKLAAKTRRSCATDHSTTVCMAVDVNELPASIGDTVLNSWRSWKLNVKSSLFHSGGQRWQQTVTPCYSNNNSKRSGPMLFAQGQLMNFLWHKYWNTVAQMQEERENEWRMWELYLNMRN